MQMINEITIMQQNKNIFNKLLSYLNKYKDVHKRSGTRKDIFLKINNAHNLRVHVCVDMCIKNFIAIQEKNFVFFCAKLDPKLWGVTFSYNKLILGNDKAALGYMRMILDDWDSFGGPSKEQRDWLESEGIKPGVSNDEIKSSNPYKNISKSLEALSDAEYKVTLDDGIQSHLTVRENIMPLLYYDIKKEEFNYPKNQYGYRNPRSSRGTFQIQDVNIRSRYTISVDDMCLRSVAYTPYTYWTILEVNSPYFSQ